MDPAKMKVVDLRSELGALGLDTKGNKPALVERLKKALEAKTGKAIADTTILDTSAEDNDDPSTPLPSTPRRAAAVRTTRRSSSSRLTSTPAKVPREDPPEPIEEEPKEEDDSPKPVQPPVKELEPVPEPILEPKLEETKPEKCEKPSKEDLYNIEDGQSKSIDVVKTEIKEKKEEAAEVLEDATTSQDKPIPKEKSIDTEMDHDGDIKETNDGDIKEKNDGDIKEKNDGDIEEKNDGDIKEKNDGDIKGENDGDFKEENDEDMMDEREEQDLELTEEEEWDLLNERLIQKEKERIEREKKQAEEDAKRLEEVKQNPIKFQRLKRKQEKKARWSNFYKSIEITNEVLAPTVEEPVQDKTHVADAKSVEPELNDNKVTLSWYDSDLNQYLELPELNSVVALGEGAFAHAWSGTRATHGVTEGRVCYEVRVGTLVTTTEILDKESNAGGLRVGWSTDNSSLHLGEDENSWGYENTGRIVSNGEFKEFGKTFTEKDVIGVYLDLESSPCKIVYTLNGAELGTAYEFQKKQLNGAALYPHILTRNICYTVNFGYDSYNMLTKTKLVRKRLEIPVEQVLEEKRKKEEEIKKQKEEAERLLREKREKDKKEREEKSRKKKEEKGRLEIERKVKEEKEKKDVGEPMEVDKDDEAKEDQEKDKENKLKVKEEKEKVKEDKEKVKEDKENVKEDKEKVKEDMEDIKEDNDNVIEDKVKAKEDKESIKEDKDKIKEDMEIYKEENEKDKEGTLEGKEQENAHLPRPFKEDIKVEPKENGEKQETTVDVKIKSMDTEELLPTKKEREDIKEESSEKVAEVTEEQVLTGHVLDTRITFVIRYTVDEELDGAEGCLIPGYVLIAQCVLVEGPRRPPTIADCEVILMIGMPGSGKTYWTKKHCAENPEKRYNIISTGALFDKMKVDCKPFRSSYEGKWDAMVSKCAKSVLKLLELAKGRRRNFILDQTNVYPSAQRRKLREFDGYRRVAVCVVVTDEVQKERSTTRQAADGKEVPDPAVLDMKANIALPEVGSWLNEVIYPELPEEEAKKVVAAYHQEAAAAGAMKEKDKRSRSASRGRDAPPSKRPKSTDRDRRDYRRRDHPREREDRWGGSGGGGSGGGSRWGAAPGGGPGGRGRWGGGGRDRGGGMGPRFDRGWGAPPPGGRNDYGRDRDAFRGGRGGPGGPRQDRGPGAPGGLGGLGGMGPTRVPPDSRFQRDNRPQQNRGPIDNKRSGQSQGSFGSSSSSGGSGSGGPNQSSSGSWQRGSQQSRGGRSNQISRQDGQNQAQTTNQNQGQNQNQNQNQGWNQWGGGWGGWGNWNNQNQGWNNWNNWGNWNNQQPGGPQQQQQGGNKQQWSNYTAQQWYQWQQWQQQQQGQWQGYNQSSQQPAASGQPGGTSTSDAAQAWAQYYQNYGGANAPSSTTPVDKK